MDFKIMDPEVVKRRMEEHAKSPQPFKAKVASGGDPHPALNGKRVTDVDNPIGIYFIWDGGRKSGIPDGDTYNSIFADWNGVLGLKSYDLDKIADGDLLTPGSGIVSADGSGGEYLFTYNQKYGISSPAVKTYCDFATAIVLRPPGILGAVPDGPFILDYGA